MPIKLYQRFITEIPIYNAYSQCILVSIICSIHICTVCFYFYFCFICLRACMRASDVWLYTSKEYSRVSFFFILMVCNGSVCIWKSSWQKSVLCLYDNYRSIQSDNQNKKCEFTFLRNNTWLLVVKKNIHNYKGSYHHSTTRLRHTLFAVKFAHCDTFDIVKAFHLCYSSFIFARIGNLFFFIVKNIKLYLERYCRTISIKVIWKSNRFSLIII